MLDRVIQSISFSTPTHTADIRLMQKAAGRALCTPGRFALLWRGRPAYGARVFCQVMAMCAAANNTEKRKPAASGAEKKAVQQKIRQGQHASGSAYRGFAARKYSSQNTQYSTSSAPVPASHAMKPSARQNRFRKAGVEYHQNMHP